MPDLNTYILTGYMVYFQFNFICRQILPVKITIPVKISYESVKTL